MGCFKVRIPRFDCASSINDLRRAAHQPTNVPFPPLLPTYKRCDFVLHCIIRKGERIELKLDFVVGLRVLVEKNAQVEYKSNKKL